MTVRSEARGLRVGVDLARVADVAASLEAFGERYLRRVFTPGEIAYALEATGPTRVERLAARFAAKEAAMKALDLSERGVAWTDIEVCREPSGACHLVFHGQAEAAYVESRIEELAVSLAHEDAFAVALVVARGSSAERVET